MGQVPEQRRMTTHDFSRKKQQHEKITILTCYDYPSARTVAESNLDCILVGDSVAMTVHGHENTIMATMDMMVLHTQAVARGLGKQFLITDLPFLSNRLSLKQTVENAQRLLQAGAHAIKLEGADPELCNTIHYLVNAGVPVMGHIGLTPQSVHQLGGYRVQGKTDTQAAQLMTQAKALQKAGCFAIVVECVPSALAETITDALEIPVIGIGAGPKTDGQVLVWHDMLGLQTEFKPHFVKQYCTGKAAFLDAINDYVLSVKQTTFPAKEHQY